MKRYETLQRNKEYLEIMKKIDSIKFINDGKWDWEHGLGHATRVAHYVEDILLQLEAEERIIDLGMTSALLHDIGLSKGVKSGHAKTSSEMFASLLEEQSLTKKEINLMYHAIRDHSKGERMRSFLDIALTLADKLDVTYHRTVHSSIQDYTNQEIQKIRKVNIEILKKYLVVDYETIEHLDYTIFKEWDKAITIPRKVATILEKNCIFTENQKEVDVLKLFQKKF